MYDFKTLSTLEYRILPFLVAESQISELLRSVYVISHTADPRRRTICGWLRLLQDPINIKLAMSLART